MNYKKAVLVYFIFFLFIFLITTDADAATLSLSPQSKSINQGGAMDILVQLDTKQLDVSGVDIVITYDTQKLSIIDADTNMSGIQISAGSLMSQTPTNSVDTNAGIITFSQVTGSSATFDGAGTLATITFSGIGSGTADVDFTFTVGATNDTNVSSFGIDVLTQAIGGTYIIGSSGSGSSGSGSGGNGGGGGSSSGGGGSSGGTSGGISSIGQTGSNIPSGSGIQGFFHSRASELVGPFGIGSRGGQVTLLQEILAVDTAIYPEGEITGFYGALTTRAVERFQIRYGIVASGTPGTTGFGLAGPTTRAKIREVFSGGIVSGQTDEALRAVLIAEIERLQIILIDLLAQLTAQLATQQGGQ